MAIRALIASAAEVVIAFKIILARSAIGNGHILAETFTNTGVLGACIAVVAVLLLVNTILNSIAISYFQAWNASTLIIIYTGVLASITFKITIVCSLGIAIIALRIMFAAFKNGTMLAFSFNAYIHCASIVVAAIPIELA